MKTPIGSKTKATVWVVENGKVTSRWDHLTTEEPLEIRLVSPRRTVAITMRNTGRRF